MSHLRGALCSRSPRGEKNLRPKPLKQPSLSPGPSCAARDLENSLPNSLPAGSFAGADDSGSRRPGTAVVWKPRGPKSNPENLGVACLDFFAEPLARRRVLLHQLDLAKRPPAGLLLDLGMTRTHGALVDQEFLALRAEEAELN